MFISSWLTSTNGQKRRSNLTSKWIFFKFGLFGRKCVSSYSISIWKHFLLINFSYQRALRFFKQSMGCCFKICFILLIIITTALNSLKDKKWEFWQKWFLKLIKDKHSNESIVTGQVFFSISIYLNKSLKIHRWHWRQKHSMSIY